MAGFMQGDGKQVVTAGAADAEECQRAPKIGHLEAPSK
jgi:hypothetical protein